MNIDGSTHGLRFNQTAGTTGPVEFGNKVQTSNALVAGSGSAIACAGGDGCFSESTTTGQINLGGTGAGCYLNYNISVASALNIGCNVNTGNRISASNGVQPNGTSNGYAPEAFPLGSAIAHPRFISGGCGVTSPSTVCTFGGSFAFANTSYQCALGAQGSAIAVGYSSTSTTTVTIFSGTTANISYICFGQ
jgi:hypothetical protein